MSDETMERANWIGAPAFYDLNMACVSIRRAFPVYGPFLVGSALERRDHRDVDVRCILDRDTYCAMFVGEGGSRGDGHAATVTRRRMVLTSVFSATCQQSTCLVVFLGRKGLRDSWLRCIFLSCRRDEAETKEER